MRRFHVVITPEAQADLDSLYAYIADQAGKKVAQTFIDRLRGYCLGLSHAPQRGESRMRKSGHRFFALILLSLLDERRIQMSDGITP
jgi:plasmid stabilization system protein ParE